MVSGNDDFPLSSDEEAFPKAQLPLLLLSSGKAVFIGDEGPFSVLISGEWALAGVPVLGKFQKKNYQKAQKRTANVSKSTFAVLYYRIIPTYPHFIFVSIHSLK